LALRLGFADQAHFVHAFTEVVGQPPATYERVPRPDGL
jgi:AraC-like DNA-binding protein